VPIKNAVKGLGRIEVVTQLATQRSVAKPRCRLSGQVRGTGPESLGEGNRESGEGNGLQLVQANHRNHCLGAKDSRSSDREWKEELNEGERLGGKELVNEERDTTQAWQEKKFMDFITGRRPRPVKCTRKRKREAGPLRERKRLKAVDQSSRTLVLNSPQ